MLSGEERRAKGLWQWREERRQWCDEIWGMEGIVGIEFVVLSLLYINGSPPPEDCKKQVTE